MNKEDLQEKVKNRWEERYKELASKIDAYIQRMADDGYTYATFRDSDWCYEESAEWYKMYPVEMYKRYVNEIKDDVTVKQWKFLCFALNTWTVSWGEEE